MILIEIISIWVDVCRGYMRHVERRHRAGENGQLKLGSRWERDNERVRAGKKRALTDGTRKKPVAVVSAPAPPPRHAVHRDPLPLLPCANPLNRSVFPNLKFAGHVIVLIKISMEAD
jgi:hypothetical protein